MKAVIYTEYGPPDVMRVVDMECPTPADDEVLIRLEATGVNAADWRMLYGDPFLIRLEYGLTKPKLPVLGSDIAGVVEAVGSGVTRFQPGDAVLGDVSGAGMGGFAEYATVPAAALIAKPEALPFVEAAALPMASVTALQALRDKGQVKAGQHVLINGASGGVGTYAVQIAKAMGAEVTAVCSTAKIEQARSLGADHVIDYTQEDFAQSGQQYDVVVAVNGDRPIGDYRHALRPGGTYVMVGGSMRQMMQAMTLGPLLSMTGDQTLTSLMAHPHTDDLAVVVDLVVAGEVQPVIDQCYPLNEVPDALRYVKAGHARGKVVITITNT